MNKDGLGFLLAYFFFRHGILGTTSGTKVYAIAYT